MFLINNLQSGRGGAHRDIYIDGMESDSGNGGLYAILVFIVVMYIFFKLRAEYYKDKK
jgi:hypothetical protein